MGWGGVGAGLGPPGQGWPAREGREVLWRTIQDWEILGWGCRRLLGWEDWALLNHSSFGRGVIKQCLLLPIQTLIGPIPLPPVLR